MEGFRYAYQRAKLALLIRGVFEWRVFVLRPWEERSGNRARLGPAAPLPPERFVN